MCVKITTIHQAFKVVKELLSMKEKFTLTIKYDGEKINLGKSKETEDGSSNH